MKSAYGRKRVNCLGFLDAVSHKLESVMNDSYLNTDSVCEGLRKIRRNVPDELLYVILDNAAYQHCRKVKDCAAELNINLIYLPPYSPNLNLIERLWKFLRSKILANKYYDSFKQFLIMCMIFSILYISFFLILLILCFHLTFSALILIAV